MRHRWIGLTALLVSSTAMAGTPAWRISEASGTVNVVHAGVTKVALRNAVVQPGDAVHTGPNARAVLVRGQEFVMVAPNSQLQLPAVEQKGAVAQLVQQAGDVIFMIKKMATPHFAVETPYLAAVVKGTTFGVHVSPTGATVKVLEGAVDVATVDGGAHEIIRPGGSVSVGAERLLALRVNVGGVDHLVRSKADTGVPAPAPLPGHPNKPAVTANSISTVVSETPVSLAQITGGLVSDLNGQPPAAPARPVLPTTASSTVGASAVQMAQGTLALAHEGQVEASAAVQLAVAKQDAAQQAAELAASKQAAALAEAAALKAAEDQAAQQAAAEAAAQATAKQASDEAARQAQAAADAAAQQSAQQAAAAQAAADRAAAETAAQQAAAQQQAASAAKAAADAAAQTAAQNAAAQQAAANAAAAQAAEAARQAQASGDAAAAAAAQQAMAQVAAQQEAAQRAAADAAKQVEAANAAAAAQAAAQASADEAAARAAAQAIAQAAAAQAARDAAAQAQAAAQAAAAQAAQQAAAQAAADRAAKASDDQKKAAQAAEKAAKDAEKAAKDAAKAAADAANQAAVNPGGQALPAQASDVAKGAVTKGK